MFKQITVLFNKFMCSQITILVEDVSFKNLLPIATICVNKKISYKYGEDIAESSETNVGCENVIVI
jgi:hypothetical protein